jgi:hypothetical protein
MKRAIGSPTRAQQSYHDAARALGCVVCRFRIAAGLQPSWAGQCGGTQIHHRNLGDLHGQRQLGHDCVVAMGAWHHDGDQLPERSRDQMRAVFGPSFKHHAREFRTWTADMLAGFSGIGTERWQQWQDAQLRLRNAA